MSTYGIFDQLVCVVIDEGNVSNIPFLVSQGGVFQDSLLDGVRGMSAEQIGAVIQALKEIAGDLL